MDLAAGLRHADHLVQEQGPQEGKEVTISKEHAVHHAADAHLEVVARALVLVLAFFQHFSQLVSLGQQLHQVRRRRLITPGRNTKGQPTAYDFLSRSTGLEL
jgi:hypothetical protein